MKQCVSLVSFILVLAACASAPVVGIVPGRDFSKIGRVALLDFDGDPSQSGSGRIVSQALEPYLLRVGYNFVERSHVEEVLKEQAFSQSGSVDPKTAQNLGKILGANALILGSVTNFALQQSETYMETLSNVTYQPIYGRRGKIVDYEAVETQDQVPVTNVTPASVGFSARLVNATTGEVLWFGSSQSDGSSPADAADAAAKKFVKALKPAWPLPNAKY